MAAEPTVNRVLSASFLHVLRWKRWIAVVAGTYGAAWLLTATMGVRQVEGVVYARLVAENGGQPPGEGTPEEWRQSDYDPRRSPYPIYEARGTCPAPFVVVVDEGITNGGLWGHGRRSVNVWLLGLVQCVSSRPTWIS